MYLFKPDEGVGEGRRLVVDSVDVTENAYTCLDYGKFKLTNQIA